MQSAVDLAKTFERRKCNHREAIAGDDCLLSVVGAFLSLLTSWSSPELILSSAGEANKHRYVIATQSDEVRQKLRTIPAVPVVHVNRAVMVLEPPSDVTLAKKEGVRQRFLLNHYIQTNISSYLLGTSRLG